MSQSPLPAGRVDHRGGVGDNPLVGVRGHIRRGLIDATLRQRQGRLEEGILGFLRRQLRGRGDLASNDPGPFGARVVDQAGFADPAGVELLQVLHRLTSLHRSSAYLGRGQSGSAGLELHQRRVISQKQVDALGSFEVLFQDAGMGDRVSCQRIVKVGLHRCAARRDGADDRRPQQHDAQHSRDDSRHSAAHSRPWQDPAQLTTDSLCIAKRPRRCAVSGDRCPSSHAHCPARRLQF